MTLEIPSFRLPFSFDPERLKADARQMLPGDWVPHFNTRYYEGEWSGVALRSVGGIATQLYPDPTAAGAYAETALLSRCPYIREEVLPAFECQLQAVRFLKLKSCSSIREHKDYNLGYEDGELRVHVPVLTNPCVEFYLNGERLVMNEGEAWYLNLNLPHRVENRSREDRIHLVIDCVLNDWLRSQFAQQE